MAEIVIIFSLSAIVFGILVILQPQILAYLLGAFFIYIGILGLGGAWQIKKIFKQK